MAENLWGERRKPRWLVPGVIVGAVIVFVVIPVIVSYNGLVGRRASADRFFADLDVQLQRRNDLIPNLVGAVRGELNQEQAVFGELARARQSYAGASSPAQKFDASNQIDAGLWRLLVIVESYPQLRSSQNIQDLQTQLEGTENRIAQARREYNAAVTTYNVSTSRFPRSIVAGLFGFQARALFRTTAAAQQVPPVDLGTTTTTAR